MKDAAKHFGQLLDGTITIASELPRQALATFKTLPSEQQKKILSILPERLGFRIPFGDVNMDNYYYNPQLFKMPRALRGPAPRTEDPKTGLGNTAKVFGVPLVVMLGAGAALWFFTRQKPRRS